MIRTDELSPLDAGCGSGRQRFGVHEQLPDAFLRLELLA
jgi:hypothetical protein